MLSSSFLAACSDDLVKYYSQLENDIVCSMAKRLSRLKTVTDATEYQAKILQEIGGLRRSVEKQLSSYSAGAKAQLLSLFDVAMQTAQAKDLQIVEAAKRNLSEGKKQILEATAERLQSGGIVSSNAKTREEIAQGGAIKTFSNLSRLTSTIAATAQEDFVNAANRAYMQAAHGAFSYQEAIQAAVNDLAEKGVRTVEYTDSGKVIHRSIESAVRTNVLTGVNLTASQQTLQNAEDLGVELFEVSAHIGARPEHEEWQGGIYTADQLRTVCRLGEPDGLCGINCRHSYYPYIQGAPRLYSNGELDELKAARMSYTDKSGNKRTVTRYEAEQKLRGIERNVRKYKRIANAQEAAGSDNTAARVKIGEWQKAARDFCEQTGLRRDYAREYIGVERSLWNTTGEQPKAKITNTVTGGSFGGILEIVRNALKDYL